MDDDGKPEWDDAAANVLVGQTVLIGLTHVVGGNRVMRREQLHGLIVSANSQGGFEVALEGRRAGETYWLPPHISAFQRAKRGEYRLRGTGEIVVDPDLISNWTVSAPTT